MSIAISKVFTGHFIISMVPFILRILVGPFHIWPLIGIYYMIRRVLHQLVLIIQFQLLVGFIYK